MKYTKKTKPKPKQTSHQISYEDAEKNLMDALKAEPSDIKVPISIRLDGDVYLELKRLAEEGLGNGKYQAFLNQILRHYLFGDTLPIFRKFRHKAANE